MFFFLAQPFWETKPPEQWTGVEIETMRHFSPWAQPAGPLPEVVVYLATAAPIEQAEAELRLRLKKNPRPMDQLDADIVEYLRDNRERNFVLAIAYPPTRPAAFIAGLGDARENKKMEEESVMVIGRKTYKIVGHFPPTPSDPVLRLIFPREVRTSDKSVLFRLYLPGINFPEREAEFRVKDLMYQGKLEM